MTVLSVLAQEKLLAQHTQERLSTWQQMRPIVEQRAKSVKTLRAFYTMEEFNNSERRSRQQKEQQEAQVDEGAMPLPSDANKVETYFWITDGTRWRCEKYRSYPDIGSNYDLAIFDGEKYIVYNSYQRMAFVSATADKVFPLAAKIPSTGALPSIQNVNEISDLEKNGFAFAVVGREKINGFDCIKYSATKTTSPNLKGTISFWLAPQQDGLIVKWQDEATFNKDRSLFVSVVLKARRIDGIVAATDVKQEQYRTKQEDEANLQWEFTRHYILKELKFNLKVGDGYFEDVLNVGMPIVNELEAPGQISYIGGDPSEEIREVRIGDPPKLEQSNVKPNGVLPKPSTDYARN